MTQQSRGDVIGDVGDHQVIRRGDQVSRAQLQDVGVDQTDVRVRGEHGLERGEQAQVQFDRHNLTCGPRQVTGQSAQAGADFQYGLLPLNIGDLGDLPQGLLILQEILSQFFAWAQAVLVEQGGYIQRLEVHGGVGQNPFQVQGGGMV